MKKISIKIWVASASVAALLGMSTQAQTPLVDYTFNGNGNNSGSLSGGTLTLSATGSGTESFVANSDPSGASSSLSLSSAYGNAANSAIGQNTGSSLNLGTLSQFTIVGWIEVTSYGSSIAPRLWNFAPSTGDAGANGIYFALNQYGSTTGVALDLRPNGTVIGSGNNNSGTFTPNTWTFFAATFDSTSATPINYYLGSPVSSITSDGTLSGTIAAPNLGATAYDSIGNRADGTRGLPGANLADFALYSGVLSTATIDSIRLSEAPEPSTLALVGLGLGGLIVTMRRRRN